MSRSNGAVPHVWPAEFGGRVAKGAGEAATRFGERLGGRADAAVAAARRRADAAAVRLQLANTSRELAHETSDLGDAVETLNAIVKANRRAGARKRGRLFVGIALGAGLAYHLDPAHGRQRRAATASLLANAARAGLTSARAVAAARDAGPTSPA